MPISKVPFLITSTWVAGFPAWGLRVAAKVPLTRFAERLVMTTSPMVPAALTPQQQVPAVPPVSPTVMSRWGAKFVSGE